MPFIRCEDCIFYKQSRLFTGNCLRYPPEIFYHNTVFESSLPITHKDSGCGQGEDKIKLLPIYSNTNSIYSKIVELIKKYILTPLAKTILEKK